MNKYIKLLLIISSVIVFGLLLYLLMWNYEPISKPFKNQLSKISIAYRNSYFGKPAVRKAISNVKSVHIKIERTVAGAIYETLEADMVTKDKSKGTVTFQNDKDVTEINFVVIGDKLYTKKGSEKYVLEPILQNPMFLLPEPGFILTPIIKQPEMVNVKVDDQNIKKAKDDIQSFFLDTQTKLPLSAQAWFDKKNRLIKLVVVQKDKDMQDLITTITYSDYNKKLDIQVPKDDELAK